MIYLSDLYTAFYTARIHKSSKTCVKRFEENLHENLIRLRNDINNRTYRAKPSTCFIVNNPTKREIFAADFRDRIVHHLYYNHVHEIFEKSFIYDSYSCIKGKGTHFGIARLKHHILSESSNYTKPCYVLKLDIRGYFMSIDRKILLKIVLNTLNKHGVNDDMIYLSQQIITLDPTENCIQKSSIEQYKGLPDSKTLFKSKPGCGLPIGNLTSQLFSNVFLNIFDQYMKRILKCKHYGRYVDDAYVVCCDKERLKYIKKCAKEFLMNNLGLELHMGKSRIIDTNKGIEFLGAFIKPHRVYISNHSLRRMIKNIKNCRDKNHKLQAIISQYGALCHYKSYNIRKKLFCDYWL